MSYKCVPSSMIETQIVCEVSDSGIVRQVNFVDSRIAKIAIKRPGGALCFFLPTIGNTNPVEFIDIIYETPPSTEGWKAGIPVNGVDTDFLYKIFDCRDNDTMVAVVILTKE